MKTKDAALFALVATVLYACVTLVDFIRDVAAAVDGIGPLLRVVPSAILAIMAISLAVFFFVYSRSQP